MTTIIEGKVFSAERALYGKRQLELVDCRFEGEEDGESAIKECTDVEGVRLECRLRYPFWHDTRLYLRDSVLFDTCRAALWYSKKIVLKNVRLLGIKALRECKDIIALGGEVNSSEAMWHCSNVYLSHMSIAGEYLLMQSCNLRVLDIEFCGKYAFQYIHNALFTRCKLDTKDAFWHAVDVTLIDCQINGEYLGWYSRNLTLIRCNITGIQALCYSENLRLVDCNLNTTLAFERSTGVATLKSKLSQLKNPAKLIITAPQIGEVIYTGEDAPYAQESGACEGEGERSVICLCPSAT